MPSTTLILGSQVLGRALPATVQVFSSPKPARNQDQEPLIALPRCMTHRDRVSLRKDQPTSVHSSTNNRWIELPNSNHPSKTCTNIGVVHLSEEPLPGASKSIRLVKSMSVREVTPSFPDKDLLLGILHLILSKRTSSSLEHLLPMNLL